MMVWRLVADAVVVFHAAYVAFVVFGLFAIVVGAALGARWVRSFPFRVIHLAAMGLVLLETLVGMVCPLTSLENDLRLLAGQADYPADFITYWTHRLIYYDWPPRVFTVLYILFTLMIIAAFVLIPPESPRRRFPR
jgi:hypothetical protein